LSRTCTWPDLEPSHSADGWTPYPQLQSWRRQDRSSRMRHHQPLNRRYLWAAGESIIQSVDIRDKLDGVFGISSCRAVDNVMGDAPDVTRTAWLHKSRATHQGSVYEI